MPAERPTLLRHFHTTAHCAACPAEAGISAFSATPSARAPLATLAPAIFVAAAIVLASLAPDTQAQTAVGAPAEVDWVRIERAGATFEMARTETTVGQFRRFVAATGTTTAAERQGGGEVYEEGWVRKAGWNWRTPFGRPAAEGEPAVHLTFDEARAFCRFAGGRLPSDAEWVSAAYTEHRAQPPAPFVRGRTYPFPTGESSAGAQCLADCGPAALARALNHGAPLSRGHGHALAGSTAAGVNGLHEMAGNAWEWVDEPREGTSTATAGAERRTRGGSWWYGAAQMRAGHLQSKPPATAVVYIGFRCARDAR